MATHSSILAWDIPWTEEPGRLHVCHMAWSKKAGLAGEYISLKKVQRGLSLPGLGGNQTDTLQSGIPKKELPL